MMTPIEEICARFAELQLERSARDAEFAEIAKFVRPIRDQFMTRDVQTPERRAALEGDVYDATAIRAQEHFAGGLYGLISNPANVWFTAEAEDERLNDGDDERAWNGHVSKTLLRSFTPAVAPFYNVVPDLYADTGTFGTGCFFNEMIPGTRRIHDQTFSLDEVWADTDEYANVTSVFRRIWWTPAQAARKFTTERLSAGLQKKLEARSSERLPFLHVVMPNDDFMPGRILMKGNKAFASIYLELAEKHQLGEAGGYDELPYQVPRWAVSGGNKYGRGLGWINLPDIKRLNIMVRDLIVAGNKHATPPILAADEDALASLRPIPNGVSFGAISPQGRQLVQYLEAQGSMPVTLEMVNTWREQIREGFHFSLMQLVSRTGMTATESLMRDEEKMRLMGPHLGRHQVEFLTPLIARRFNMLWRAGQIPPPPDSMRGQPLKIVYSSPMAQAQNAADATATLRVAEGLLMAAQLDPGVIDRFNGDAAADILQKGFQAPPGILFGLEETEARRQARQQAQAMASALAAGQQGADIANKLGIQVPTEAAAGAA